MIDPLHADDEEITTHNCEEKTGYEYYDLIHLTGISGYLNMLRYEMPEEDITQLLTSSIKGRFPRFIVDVLTPNVQLRCRIDFENKLITNHYIKVKHTRKGIGVNIIKNQIYYLANEFDFKAIRCIAEGHYEIKDYMCGYIVWAKLGFTMTEKSKLKYEAFLRDHQLEYIPINELLLGKFAHLWEQKGKVWEGIFDLHKDSESRRLLKNYAHKKKNKLLDVLRKYRTLIHLREKNKDHWSREDNKAYIIDSKSESNIYRQIGNLLDWDEFFD